MANNRDGGTVILGIRESKSGELVLEGLSPSDLATWNHDALSDTLSEYADPSVPFETQVLEFQGKKFVLIEVNEFPDIPVLCKKDYQGVLRKGACYVRSRRKPETAEIPSQEDMRDLLDLAIEKGVSKFVGQAHSAGLSLSGGLAPSDEDRYAAELEDLERGMP